MRKNQNFLDSTSRKGGFVAIVLFFLILPAISFAGGPVQGAKASSMGTAFVAVADDPSAIAHNPAGLTQLTGTNIYGGNTFVIPSTTYENLSGQSEDTDFQVFFPPHLYVVSDFGMKDMRFSYLFHHSNEAMGFVLFTPVNAYDVFLQEPLLISVKG